MRARLLLITASALVPLAFFSFAALYHTTLDKRASVEEAMVETVRAISGSVDSELYRVAAAAQALSHSPHLDRSDFAGFYAQAKAVLADHPLWLTLSLATPEGRYLLNLQRPYGSELPSLMSDLETFERIRATRQAHFGNVFRGKVSGQHLYTVRVPVLRGEKVRQVISVAVRPEAMLVLVRRQQIPPQSIVAIIDPAGHIVARSRRHEEFLGRPITADLREAIESRREGFATLFTLEGQKTYAAFTRSLDTGWSVALGMPAQALDAPLRRSYGLLAAGVALSLVLGAGTALLLARRVARPIQDLALAAHGIGRGETPPVPATGIPELDAVGTALARSATARQQSEHAREALLRSEREARALAERLNSQKDEFLAMLGHELRNPLGVIKNGAEVLLIQVRDDALAREAAARIARQASHMAHLLNDLLESSRVVAGKIELDAEPLDLGAKARAVMELFTQSKQLDHHRIQVHCESAWVLGDRHRIEQIITNLLGNALKYSAHDSTVRLTVSAEPAHAVLRVRDEGIGMSEETRLRVFDLFFQGKMNGAPGTGLGVGLTLVRRLVELHGGSIEAESPGPGRGSLFTVRLPRVPRPDRKPDTDIRAAPPPPTVVAVIEDNEDARATLRQLLELRGHRVIEAADGAEGAALLLEQRPALALIDLAMPGTDGFECARRVRERPEGKHIMLVALTGYGSAADRERALQAGFDLHLTKPVTPQALDEVVADARARTSQPGRHGAG